MMKSKKKKEGKKKRDNNAWLNISKLNRTFLAPATILSPGSRRRAKGEISRMRPREEEREGVFSTRGSAGYHFHQQNARTQKKLKRHLRNKELLNGIWLPVTVNVFPISVTCNRFLYLITKFMHCYNPKQRNQNTRALLSPTVLPRGERVGIQNITKAELKSYHLFRILHVCLTP